MEVKYDLDLGGGGLYSDVGFTSFPQSVAIMGSSLMGSDTSSIGSKRSRADASSVSSGSESSSMDKKMMERERNRRQARKSRTLKKQCTERLQQELNQLRKGTEEAKAKDEEAAQQVAERRAAWCRALRKVFDLRAHVCSDEDAWLEVVTEDLRLILPITPYRSFNPFDVVNNRLVLLGVDGIISDTQSLKVVCDNIGVKTRGMEMPVSVAYSLGTDSDGDGAFFNEHGLMCTFTMRTLDAVAHGAANECEKNGMIRARFDSDNKIEELDMTFDAISFYHQLMRASGVNKFPLVPNTLDHALKDEKSRIVVTTAKRPFRITHVNDAWTKLCGFEIEECRGKSLSILQGPETNMNKVADLCAISEKGYAASMVVTNHNKKGELFRNYLRCYPVSSDEPGPISHIVGMLTEIPTENEEPRGMRMSAMEAF